MTTVFCSAAEPDAAAVNVSCSGMLGIRSSLTSILVWFCQAATEQLEQENRQLRAEVERLKEKLVALDIRGGGEDSNVFSGVTTLDSTTQHSLVIKILLFQSLRSPHPHQLQLSPYPPMLRAPLSQRSLQASPWSSHHLGRQG